MSLTEDIVDMRSASLVLGMIGAHEWAGILSEIASAAADTSNGEAPMMERMRWTPVVVHAGELSRKIMAAATDIRDRVARIDVDDNDRFAPIDLDSRR